MFFKVLSTKRKFHTTKWQEVEYRLFIPLGIIWMFLR